MERERSSFIDGAAWALILLSGLHLLLLALQAFCAARLAGPLQSLLEALSSFSARARYPAWASWLSDHYALLAGLGAAFSALRLGAAAGVLFRKEWARQTLVLLLLLGAARRLVGAFLQALLLTSGRLPPLPDGGLRLAMFFSALALLAASAGLTLGFLWLASRLSAPQVREEFS